MKVQFDGKKYCVWFAHQRGNVTASRASKTEDVTFCFIGDGDNINANADREQKIPILASGRVVRYYKDPFDKDAARKAALAKALDELSQGLGPMWNMEHHIKMFALRTEFWKAYLKLSPLRYVTMRKPSKVLELISTLERMNKNLIPGWESHRAAFNQNTAMICALRWAMGENTITQYAPDQAFEIAITKSEMAGG